VVRTFDHLFVFSDVPANLATVADVGGKGLHLGELAAFPAETGVRVPEGVIVPTAVYTTHITELGLTLAQGIFTSDGSVDTAALAAVRSQIQDCKLASTLTAELQTWLQTLPEGTTLAVRSSATVEDGADFSMAGIAETYLHVEPEVHTVSRAILHCWASLWQPRVLAYLQCQQTSSSSVAAVVPYMAVVVQVMIPAEVSGVLFTLDPRTGNEKHMFVEAVYGLGEGLVGGDIDPASFCIDWTEQDICESEVPAQLEKFMRLPASTSNANTTSSNNSSSTSNAGLVPTSEIERKSTCLSESLLLELCAIGKAIACHYGHPQDIEFAVLNGVIYVTQTRPITRYTMNLNSVLPPSQKDVNWYSGFTDKEYLAMSISSINGYYHAQVDGMEEKVLELFQERDSVVRPIFGIAYISSTGQMAAQFGVRPDEYQQGVGRDVWKRTEQYVQHVKEKMLPFYWSIWNEIAPESDKPDKQVIDLPILCKIAILTLNERTEGSFHSFQTGARAKHYLTQLQHYIHHYNKLLKKKGYPEKDMLNDTEFIGDPRAEAGSAGRKLRTLAQEILTRAQDDLTVVQLLTEKSASSATEALFNVAAASNPNTAQRELAQYVKQQLTEYILQFYYFADVDEKMHVDRYFDDPSPVLATLKIELIALTTTNSTGQPDDQKQQKQLPEQQQQAVSSPVMSKVEWARALLESQKKLFSNKLFRDGMLDTIQQLRTFLYWKEEIHELYCKQNFFLCALLLHIAGELVKLDLLDSAKDIFYFDLDSLQNLLQQLVVSGGVEVEDTAPLRAMKEHKTVREMFAHFDPPVAINSKGMQLNMIRQASLGFATNVLHGHGCSPGTVTGLARVIASLDEADQVQKGEILVVNTTSPGWTPLFSVIAGLVTEKGGLLSHGAVVARETGIPAVLRAKKACRYIKTGDKVTIDGDAGTVTVHGLDKEGEEEEEEEQKKMSSAKTTDSRTPANRNGRGDKKPCIIC
jgi:pyruvate,water dikinase